MDCFQKKVFVIEDDIELCDKFKKLLEGSELYVVVDEVSGVTPSVLEQIKNDPPDIILLDLILQKSSGITFLKKLNEEFETLPIIIAITAITSEQILNSLDRMGVDYRFDKNEFKTKDKFVKDIISHMEDIYQDLRIPKLKMPLELGENVIKFNPNNIN